MKRLLLDTNIYGLMAEKNEAELFKTLINTAPNTIIYGCTVVRKELRDTPKEKILSIMNKIRNYRIFLIELYDAITKNHEIVIDTKTQDLANKYLKYFTEITGKTAIKHLKNDFLLVACATLNKLDFITSEDHATLFSHNAIRTYQFVNLNEELTQPPVITYEELKKYLTRWSP